MIGVSLWTELVSAFMPRRHDDASPRDTRPPSDVLQQRLISANEVLIADVTWYSIRP